MTTEEWHMIRERLTDYKLVPDEDIGIYCKGMHVDTLFCPEEINSIEAVYYIGKNVRLPIADQLFESVVSVCPNDNGVSVFFVVYLSKKGSH